MDFEKYGDFYGCLAYIHKNADGTCFLTVYDRRGNMIHEKHYNTYRGAKIAMGRMSESWARR